MVTSKITILPVDAPAEILGASIKKHLELSENNMPDIKDFKTYYSNYLKAAGFKNSKAEYLNAKQVYVVQKEQIIRISPSHNGGATGKERGFGPTKNDEKIQVDINVTEIELGEQIKNAWAFCTTKAHNSG